MPHKIHNVSSAHHICRTENPYFWRIGRNKIIHLTDHFVFVVIFSAVREDIAEKGTYITMEKLLSEDVQVYGSRACPFIENKLSLSA